MSGSSVDKHLWYRMGCQLHSQKLLARQLKNMPPFQPQAAYSPKAVCIDPALFSPLVTLPECLLKGSNPPVKLETPNQVRNCTKLYYPPTFFFHRSTGAPAQVSNAKLHTVFSNCTQCSPRELPASSVSVHSSTSQHNNASA
eukprot:2922410-Amphidinium_carterae.1